MEEEEKEPAEEDDDDDDNDNDNDDDNDDTHQGWIIVRDGKYSVADKNEVYFVQGWKYAKNMPKIPKNDQKRPKIAKLANFENF